MSDHGITARPYAQAIFEIARADNQLEDWSRFLKTAAEIAVSPEATRVLRTPGADAFGLASAITDISRQQLGDIALLKDGQKSVAANALQVLAENQRLDALPEILARFDRLKAEAEKTLDVVLTSASPVSDAQQQRIVEALKKRFERQIRLTVLKDPTLIGGARLQVGDRIIDGSVRTGLDKLTTALRA